jgi:hypothetical protein
MPHLHVFANAKTWIYCEWSTHYGHYSAIQTAENECLFNDILISQTII